MIFSKPFICFIGTTHLRQLQKVHVDSFASFRNYCKLFNRKIEIKTELIRSVKTRSRRSRVRERADHGHATIHNDVFKKNGVLPMSMLWKPLIFTVSFSAGTFASCAIWQYENIRQQTSLIRAATLWHWSQVRPKKSFFNDLLDKTWNRLSDAEKVFSVICFANVLVHGAWMVRRFQPLMFTYFASNPISRARCWPLILSTFSHSNTVHLGMNMYALHSFSEIAVNSLGKEQFLCLYLMGGSISSFGSLFCRVVRNRPDISFGASGAVFALIGYVASRYPDLQLSLIFLPTCTFTAASALKFLIAVDLLGLIVPFRFLDHAAHLVGNLFGIFWFHYGSSYFWNKKDGLLQWWHKVRGVVK